MKAFVFANLSEFGQLSLTTFVVRQGMSQPGDIAQRTSPIQMTSGPFTGARTPLVSSRNLPVQQGVAQVATSLYKFILFTSLHFAVVIRSDKSSSSVLNSLSSLQDAPLGASHRFSECGFRGAGESDPFKEVEVRNVDLFKL